MTQQIALASLNQSASVTKPSFLKFDIPQSVAHVRDHFVAEGNPVQRTLYIIEDAHTNPSAQLNIFKTLQQLQLDQSVNTVFMEASTGNSSLDFLHPYATKENRYDVGLSYLKKGLLQGSELSSLVSEENMLLWGVEEPSLYDQSVDLYQQSVKYRDETERYLARLRKVLLQVAKQTLGANLYQVIENKTKYENDSISFSEYLYLLMNASQQAGIPYKNYPIIHRLNQMKELESRIDFKEAGSQQNIIFNAVLTSEANENESLKEMIRSGKANNSATNEDAEVTLFREDLLSFIQSRKDLQKQTENYQLYLSYLKEVAQLKVGEALEELKALEERVLVGLSENPKQLKVLKTIQSLEIISDLNRLQLRPSDFQILTSTYEAFDLVKLLAFINESIFEMGADLSFVTEYDERVRIGLEKAYAFYCLTLERDQYFVRNLLLKMQADQLEKAVLIAGGFHTENLKNLLKSRGVSFVVLSPQVLHETNHVKYETLLTISSKDHRVSNRDALNQSNAGIRAMMNSLRPLEDPIHPNVPLIFSFAEDVALRGKPTTESRTRRQQVARALKSRRDVALTLTASRLSVNPDRAIARILIDEDGSPIGYQVFESPEERNKASIHTEYIDFFGPAGMRKAAELLTLLSKAPNYDELIAALGPYQREKDYITLLKSFRAQYETFFANSEIFRLKIDAKNDAFVAFLIKEKGPLPAGKTPKQLLYVVNLNRSVGSDRRASKENANILPPSQNPELIIDIGKNIRLRDVKPSYSSLKHNEISYFRRGQALVHSGIHIALSPFFEDGKRSSQMIFLEEQAAQRLNYYIHQDKTRVTGTKRLKGSDESAVVNWDRPLRVKAGETVIFQGTLHLSFPQDHPEAIESMTPTEVERRVTATLITDAHGFAERIPVRLLPGQIPEVTRSANQITSAYDYQAEVTIPDPGLFQFELEFSIPGDEEQLNKASVARSGVADPKVAELKDVTFLGFNQSETRGSVIALATEDDRLLKPTQRRRIADAIVSKILSEEDQRDNSGLVDQMKKVVYDMLGSVMKEGGVMASPDLDFDFDHWQTAVKGNPAYGYVWIRDAASFGSALIDLYLETGDVAIAETIEKFRDYLNRAVEHTHKIDAQRFSISGRTVPPSSWGHQSDGPGHVAQFLLKYLRAFPEADSPDVIPPIGRQEALELLSIATDYIVGYAEKAYYFVQHRDFINRDQANNDPRAHDYWEVMFGMNFSTDIHFYSVLEEIKKATDLENGYIQDKILSQVIQRPLIHADNLTAFQAIKEVLKIYEQNEQGRPSRYIRSQRHVGNYEDFLEQKPEGIDAVVIAALTMVENPRYLYDDARVLATYNVIDDAYQNNHHDLHDVAGTILDYTLRSSNFWKSLRDKFTHAVVWWRHPGDSYNGLYLNAGFGKPSGKGNPWHISIDWPVMFNIKLTNYWIDNGGIQIQDAAHLREIHSFIKRHGLNPSSLGLEVGFVPDSDERFQQILSAIHRTIEETLALQQALIPEGESASEQIDTETGLPRGATALTWSNWQYTIARLEKKKLTERLIERGLLVQVASRLSNDDNPKTTVSLPKGQFNLEDQRLIQLVHDTEASFEQDERIDLNLTDDERIRLSEIIGKSFYVSDDQLNRIADKANQDIAGALAGKTSSLLMKESEIDLELLAQANGLGLGIDFGGTKVHLKLAKVNVEKGEVEIIASEDIEIPVDNVLKAGGSHIFEFLANSVQHFMIQNNDLVGEKEVPSVFVFSYPKGKNGEIVEPTATHRGSDIKNANFAGTYGQKPRDILNRLLKEQQSLVDIKVDPNDTETVAAFGYAKRPSTISGIVGGGGFNIAVRIGDKLYNVEMGNLSLGIELTKEVLNENDHIVYTRGLENLVSGIFLGERTRLELKHLIDLGLLFDGQSSNAFNFKVSDEDESKGFNSRYVSVIAADATVDLEDTNKALQKVGITNATLTDRKIVKNIIDKIFERSYRAVAAAQVGIYRYLDANGQLEDELNEGGASFTADGSVIGSDGYLVGVNKVLEKLLGTGLLRGIHEDGSSTIGGIIAVVAQSQTDGSRLTSATDDLGSLVGRLVLSNNRIQRRSELAEGVFVPAVIQNQIRVLQIQGASDQLSWTEHQYFDRHQAGQFAGSFAIAGGRLSSDVELDWRLDALSHRRDAVTSTSGVFDQLALGESVQNNLDQVDHFVATSGYELNMSTHYQIPMQAFQIEDDRIFQKQMQWLVSNMKRAHEKWGKSTTFELTGLEELRAYHFESHFNRHADRARAEKFATTRQRVIERVVRRYADFILKEPTVEQVNRVRLFVPELGQSKEDGPVNISIEVIRDQGAVNFYSLFGASKGIVGDLTRGGISQGYEQSTAEDITQSTFDFVNTQTATPFETKSDLYDFTVAKGLIFSFDILRRHTWRFLRIFSIGSEIQSFQTMIYTVGISA